MEVSTSGVIWRPFPRVFWWAASWQGVGGLGHLGIQFARKMGFRTVAIGRGRDKVKLAEDLGAHLYIDAAVEDAAAALQRMGGARAILATGTSGAALS